MSCGFWSPKVKIPLVTDRGWGPRLVVLTTKCVFSNHLWLSCLLIWQSSKANAIADNAKQSCYWCAAMKEVLYESVLKGKLRDCSINDKTDEKAKNHIIAVFLGLYFVLLSCQYCQWTTLIIWEHDMKTDKLDFVVSEGKYICHVE